MNKLPMKWLALLCSLALGAACVAHAQDNRAILDLLVRKGTITDQEAEDLRSEVAKQNLSALVSTGLGANLEKLALTGRFQSQFVGLGTETGVAASNPAATNHFLLRRIYLGMKPQFANGWSGFLNYDFAGSTFDAAQITWSERPELVLDIGFRKVPFGYDEWSISSGALKAIERSSITRFFVESNNGLRLGGGSYRQGVFVGGASSATQGGWSYNFAVTNPERDESAAGAAGVGGATNNNFAYWGNFGYSHKFGEGLLNSWKIGASAGLLTDQGGSGLSAAGAVLGGGGNVGKRNDLSVFSVYADFYYDKFSLVGEYYWAKDELGRLGSTATTGLDSKPSGFWIQPSYRFGQYELVARYGQVDSDGRGIQPGDLIRSAPSVATGLTMDTMNDWYFGLNWYILGNDLKHDVKFQIGYTKATSKDRLVPAAAPVGVKELTTEGVRAQMQINF